MDRRGFVSGTDPHGRADPMRHGLVIGVSVIVGGILLIVLGGQFTGRRIKREFGYLDNDVANMARRAGAVPKWFSLIVLLGWAAVVTGAVLLFVL